MMIRGIVGTLLIVFFAGCATEIHETRIRFGLNSCFALEKDEKVVGADKEIEMFYREYSEIKNVSTAFNKIIRSHSNDFIFITLITDKKFQDFPAIFSSDTSLRSLTFKSGTLGVGNVQEYCAAVSTKKNQWNYCFVFFDKTIGQPFLIIVSSNDKKKIDSYFSSVEFMKKRLECEAPSE